MLKLNNEQRKHLATTLRSIGIGALVAISSKLLLGGNLAVDLTIAEMSTLFALAGALEIQALSLLGGITNG